jgi:hypothetical protein
LNADELKSRTKQFAIAIIQFVQTLPQNTEAQEGELVRIFAASRLTAARKSKRFGEVDVQI